MKNITAAISILLAFLASSQVVKSTNATAPNFADGTVSVDTTGTSLKKWSIYRVSNSAIQGKELETNFKTKSGLAPGTYWVLGKKQDDGLAKFSLDTLIDISIAVAKDCDSLKVISFNAMQQPDPQNPQSTQMLTCLSYSVNKAYGYVSVEKIYTKNWDNTFTQYYGPSQGGCYPNLQADKLYAILTDGNGCSVVGTNNKENKPAGPPVMVVPGTEPGPILNHVTIGVADCSGYYIHYNDVQYKICNYAAAQAAGIVHLDSIIVSGKFLSDCGDNTPVCQMYHPYAGLFWLDSARAIPAKPAKANCWDSYQFNTATLVWDNKGSQPAMPSDTIYVYQFDSASCAWDNIGLKDSSKLSIGTVDIKAAFWPNPFGDRIEVGLSPGYFGTLTTIEGKAIRRFEAGGGPIDTKDLQPGTYFINIEGNRRSISLKAIKQ